MRRAGRRDLTHAEVRDGWRTVVGRHNVIDSGGLGGSFGDLVLGLLGLTFVLEVKRDEKAEITVGQQVQMQLWRGGPWLVVYSFSDSVEKVGAELRRRGLRPPAIRAGRA